MSEAQKLKTPADIDDLYKNACQDGTFPNLVIAGRHRNIYLMTLGHKIYQLARNSKPIDLNVTQGTLLKNLRDVEQTRVLGRQVGDKNFSWRLINQLRQNLLVIY